MSFAFAGTPQFAAWVLGDLALLGRHPSLVLTQPSRPSGRGQRVCSPPAALQAAALGLPHAQAADINSGEILDRLRDAGVSVLVVASFGQMLRRQLLDAVLCINIHASLLPAYRGAAPIQRAIAAGETLTGITIMRVIEELDAGPVALQRSISIDPRDDSGTVTRLLALMGAVGVSEVLASIADGTLTWTDQKGATSYACKLTSADLVLDPKHGARAVHDQARSLSPSPGARAACGDVEFKVLRTWPFGQRGLDPVPAEAREAAGVPGRVVVGSGRLFVGCAEGVVEVLFLQPAGKAGMRTAAFLRGYGGRLGSSLASTAAGDER